MSIHCTTLNPTKIPPCNFNEIIRLHQKTFYLPAKLLSDLLKKRSLIDIYSDSNTHKIIGTAGLQWIVRKKYVYVYVGNVVVDRQHRKSGILTRSIMHAIVKTLIKYPHKKYRFIYFSTSKEAYNFKNKFVEFWPREDISTPNAILKNMKNITQHLVGNHFKIKDNKIIVHYINKYLRQTKACHYESKKYDQVVCMVTLGWKDILHVAYIYFKNLMKFFR